MPTILAERGLAGRDAGFATELAFGTLRMRALLDAVLARCVDRPLDRLDPSLLDLLRLGAYQLLEMRVPAHAAVGESVALARDVRGEGPSRLTNAVLRKVAARDREGWLGVVVDGVDDPSERLAITTSHPAWVVRALGEAMAGADADELESLLLTDNLAPRVTLVARPGRASVAELEQSADVEPGRWSPYAAVLRSGPPGEVLAVREHRAGVQDEGSQLVALALAGAPLDGGPDARWLDLCAGPGGKAALLAALAAERGATLTAVELSPHRADLVRRTLAGAPGVEEVVTADGTDERWATGLVDRVLVDAPCTGLGVLRRRPEARWRRTPADVGALARLQRDLLRTALAAVRPGGVVAYATCSPHLAETDLVVDDVLRGRDDVERVDAWTSLPPLRAPLPRREGDTGPALRLWPHLHDTDGMYLALLRRAR